VGAMKVQGRAVDLNEAAKIIAPAQAGLFGF
jgi:hypothetical protein